MTIYDLTEALKRYGKAIAIAFVILFLLVVAMTFTIDGWKPTFRAGLKYESAVQIAVVAPGTDSLTSSSGDSGSLANAADLYASLLESDEAAHWIGEQNDYTLESLVEATAGSNSTVITARVTGPTPEQAKGAALSTFDWLNKKLREPVETANFPSPSTTTPAMVLESSFESFVDVNLDAGLADVPEGLFLFIDHGGVIPIGLPLQQSADSTVRARAILRPLTTVVLTLATASGEALDTLRLAPDPTPRVVEAVPELSIDLKDGSVRQITIETTEGTDSTWNLVGSEITVDWKDGAAVPQFADPVTVDVDLALLTPEPGFTVTGGRRGPITGIAALLVGSVLILAGVIVVDTWRRDAETRAVRPVKLPPTQQPSPLVEVSTASGTAQRCLGVRRDGEPCQSPITGASGYCLAHDPHTEVGDTPPPDIEIHTADLES